LLLEPVTLAINEELGISKNSAKPYKNTNFDKEDILANHKSFMSSLNIPINEENCEVASVAGSNSKCNRL
jgi:hypothetical protein